MFQTNKNNNLDYRKYKVFKGHGSVFIVQPNGEVLAYGSNQGGKLGVGSSDAAINSFQKVKFPKSSTNSIKKISTGKNTTLFLTNDGTLYCSGKHQLFDTNHLIRKINPEKLFFNKKINKQCINITDANKNFSVDEPLKTKLKFTNLHNFLEHYKINKIVDVVCCGDAFLVTAGVALKTAKKDKPRNRRADDTKFVLIKYGKTHKYFGSEPSFCFYHFPKIPKILSRWENILLQVTETKQTVKTNNKETTSIVQTICECSNINSYYALYHTMFLPHDKLHWEMNAEEKLMRYFIRARFYPFSLPTKNKILKIISEEKNKWCLYITDDGIAHVSTYNYSNSESNRILFSSTPPDSESDRVLHSITPPGNEKWIDAIMPSHSTYDINSNSDYIILRSNNNKIYITGHYHSSKDISFSEVKYFANKNIKVLSFATLFGDKITPQKLVGGVVGREILKHYGSQVATLFFTAKGEVLQCTVKNFNYKTNTFILNKPKLIYKILTSDMEQLFNLQKTNTLTDIEVITPHY